MQSILVVGVIIFTGLIFGELAEKVRLPNVTGYIIAGILLNPDLLGFVSRDFVDHTSLAINICLAFITFSVGGTLLRSRLKKLRKKILCITVCEAEFSFLTIAVGFLVDRVEPPNADGRSEQIEF